MTPQPASVLDEAMSFVNTLVRQDGKPTKFDLMRLDKMIEKIQAVDIAGGYSFRGIYYALLCEYEKSKKFHRMSIDIAKGQEAINNAFHNYCFSLMRLGEHEEAFNLMMTKLSEHKRDNISFIDALLRCAYYVSRDDIIDEWGKIYTKLTGKEHYVIEWIRKLHEPHEDTEPEDVNDDITAEQCFIAAYINGGLADWYSKEEDEAWQHLQ
jgi:hypothetical protein